MCEIVDSRVRRRGLKREDFIRIISGGFLLVQGAEKGQLRRVGASWVGWWFSCWCVSCFEGVPQAVSCRFLVFGCRFRSCHVKQSSAGKVSNIEQTLYWIADLE